MADNITPYIPRLVQINYGGITLSGLAESFASGQRNSDFTSNTVGGDGSVQTTISPDRTGTFEITFQQNSTANSQLAALIALSEASNEFYEAAVTLTDASGGAIVSMSGCHITSGPTMSFGSEAQDRTWTIFAKNYTYLQVPEGISASAAAVLGNPLTAEAIAQFKV